MNMKSFQQTCRMAWNGFFEPSFLAQGWSWDVWREKHPEVSAFSPQVFLNSHFPLVRRMVLFNIFVSGTDWFSLGCCLMAAMACSVCD